MKDSVSLRDIRASDLDVLFEQQLDPQANDMAAFTSKDPADREAFEDRWARIRADERILVKTILYRGQIAGSILTHTWFGEPEVSYWLGREFWGRGIATRALIEFLDYEERRPLYARVAKDNLASIRVLQKCGFEISGEDQGFANARGEEIEEYILALSTAGAN